MSRHETSHEFKQDYYIEISPIVEMTLIVRFISSNNNYKVPF